MRPLITTTLIALGAIVSFPPSSAASAAGWTWPVRGEVITPYRNGDDPYASGQHRGIDIAAPAGADVGAATAGRVTFAGRAGSSGLTVSVRTSDGRFDTSYLHLSAIDVRRGDEVHGGQRLGAVGVSGSRSAEAPHLHFGVREADSRHAYRDPLSLLPPLGKPAPAPEPPGLPVEVPLVPVPPAPVPSELPRPVAVPDGAPAADPRRAPEPKSLPLPTPVPLPAALRAPTPGRASVASPSDSRRAARVPATRGGSPGTANRPAPASGPVAAGPRGRHPGAQPPLESRAATGPRSAAAPSPPNTPDRAGPAGRAAGSPDGGLNLGWLAACIGLIAVALALGRAAGPAEAARTARTTVRAIAGPLTGRG